MTRPGDLLPADVLEAVVRAFVTTRREVCRGDLTEVEQVGLLEGLQVLGTVIEAEGIDVEVLR